MIRKIFGQRALNLFQQCTVSTNSTHVYYQAGTVVASRTAVHSRTFLVHKRSQSDIAMGKSCIEAGRHSASCMVCN